MPKELLPKNTPESLGVTPRYVLQHNAISKSAQNLSATAKKLTAMAMALLPPDLSSLTASFTFTEFCNALGYEKGGKSYQIFRTAVRECMKCLISIETEPDQKGKKKWKEFTWFTVAEYDESTDKASMTFSNELADFLAAFKWVYTKINLKDIGILQSKYAIRLFEIAMSGAFLQGKNGNRSKEWYFQASIIDFRFMFGVPKGTYKETHLLRRYIIENPIKEINDAGIGIEITSQGIKQGRNLVAIRLNCKQIARKLTKIPRKSKKNNILQLELSGISLKTADQIQEKELEHLKELHPEEFALLYQEAFTKQPSFLPPTSSLRKLAAEGEAKAKLREKYGIVK
jgi:plasmid replication initiation protein